MSTQEVSNYLSISAYQFAPQWLAKKHNIQQILSQIEQLDDKPDLFILPEMFNTGFTMEAVEYAETMEGETIETLKYLAREYDMAICGSLIIRDKASYYNRFVFCYPEGEIVSYDKKHLFTMGDEHTHYTPGTSRMLIEYKGWKIFPAICYDLRFPVWCRNNQNYDLMICSANWPTIRNEVWETLLKARAIENQCYVAGINRTGTDGNDIDYSGQSQVLNARGEILQKASDQPELIEMILDKYKLNDFRKKFPVLKDGDSFQLF